MSDDEESRLHPSEPLEFLVEMSSIFNDPEALASAVKASPDYVEATDILLAELPFPLTVNTLYAMMYGAMLNLTLIEVFEPRAKALVALMGGEMRLSDHFMLVLAECSRRILNGEIEAPESATWT